jgi:hypothetical protein
LAYAILGSYGPTLDKLELDHMGGLSFHPPIHAALPLILHKKGKKFLKKEKEKKTKQNCYCCLNAAQCIEVER